MKSIILQTHHYAGWSKVPFETKYYGVLILLNEK